MEKFQVIIFINCEIINICKTELPNGHSASIRKSWNVFIFILAKGEQCFLYVNANTQTLLVTIHFANYLGINEGFLGLNTIGVRGDLMKQFHFQV